VRELGQELLGRGEPDLLHQAHDFGLDLVPGLLALVQLYGALKVIAHSVDGVERGERVLENKLHLALVASKSRPAGYVDRPAVQGDGAPGGFSCPARSLATVDLPEPLSPTRATTAPR